MSFTKSMMHNLGQAKRRLGLEGTTWQGLTKAFEALSTKPSPWNADFTAEYAIVDPRQSWGGEQLACSPESGMYVHRNA